MMMGGILNEKTLMEIGETLLVHSADEWREAEEEKRFLEGAVK